MGRGRVLDKRGETHQFFFPVVLLVCNFFFEVEFNYYCPCFLNHRGFHSKRQFPFYVTWTLAFSLELQ